MSLSRAAALAMVPAVLAAAPGAHAGPRASVRLAYERGAGARDCPGEAALREAVTSHLGYDPFADTDAAGVRVVIAANRASRTATVTLTGRGGERIGGTEVSSARASCDELVHAVGIHLAFVLGLLEPAPPGAPECVAPPSRSPAVDASPARQSEPAGFLVVVSAGALVAFSPASATAPGLAWSASMRWPSTSIGLEARALLPSEATTSPGHALDVSSVTVAALPCMHVAPASACAVGRLGRLLLAGPDAPGDERAYTDVAAGARVGVTLPVTERIELAAQGEVTGALSVHTLSRDGDEVWTTPGYLAAVGVGVGARF